VARRRRSVTNRSSQFLASPPGSPASSGPLGAERPGRRRGTRRA
jgi:hypothetical protein